MVPQPARARRDYDALTAEAATAPAGAQGLFWLPYLMGERTPHLDATARGGWIGLTARHKRADLIRAVHRRRLLQPARLPGYYRRTGRAVESVRASGGGASSPFWRQLLADILDKKVVTLETQEGSAYGAALLALAGTGEYGSVPEVCRAAIHETESVQPQTATPYTQGHKTYQSLYPALKNFFTIVAKS